MTSPTLGDIGEFGAIARISSRLPQGTTSLLGPGDDAAVVESADGRVVISTDMLVENRHFRLDWSPPYDIGRKAAAQSLVDIAAMGAKPTALVVALGAPATTPLETVEEIAHGMAAEAGRANASVVGGDLAAAEHLVIAVTAVGTLEGRAPVLRSGARPGDVVIVVGALGASAAGLYQLEQGWSRVLRLVALHRCPEPRYTDAVMLAQMGATSMIDTSDGLMADVAHLTTQSRVGMKLDVSKIPRAFDIERVADPATVLKWVLTGGEDHAIVATLPPESVEQVQRRLGPGSSSAIIGEVTRPELGVVWIGVPGDMDLTPGFDHFRTP